MMQESRLTNTQQRNLEKSLRGKLYIRYMYTCLCYTGRCHHKKTYTV